MRELIFTDATLEELSNLCEYVELKNTSGSGSRFNEKFTVFLQEYLPLTNLQFPLCNNALLAKLFYSCIIFKSKWVVAFRYSEEQITIHRIILGSKLK